MLRLVPHSSNLNVSSPLPFATRSIQVWQDLSSWNVEFSTVYPEYSLKSINRLELLFLGAMKWDMSISSSLYAKYYFALRSLTEKEDFRRRYNRVLQVQQSFPLYDLFIFCKRPTAGKPRVKPHPPIYLIAPGALVLTMNLVGRGELTCNPTRAPFKQG